MKMGLFDVFKKKGIVLGSPLEGECVSLKQVNDPTFSEEILGKGIAVVPVNGKVYAPADCEITTVFPTGHALGLTTAEGVEILIHIGLDTVKLSGQHFTIHTETGAKVSKGDLLIEADIEQIKAAGYDVITPMIVCNTSDYLDSIRGMIRDEKMNAEYAVSLTGDNFAGVFASMDDEYMKARSADVLDISKRLIRILAGVGEEGIVSEEPVILLADDLSPSETVQMDKSKILAIVTKHGSTNSHTAILARSMNIPALVQTDVALLEEYSGAKAVVDGFSGTFIINPEDSVLDTMVQKKMEYEKERTALQELKGKDNITSDGRRINLYANIGNVSDVDKVLESDAGGIGLFRSEFIYLGREDYPSEEEQFHIYNYQNPGYWGRQAGGLF